jgi:Flp pilus assembly protein TadD
MAAAALFISFALSCRDNGTESEFVKGDRAASRAACLEAEAALRENRADDALRAWDRARDLDSSDPLPHASAARYYWLRRQFKESAAAYEGAARRDPKNAELLMEWIQTLKDGGDSTRIESLARKAVTLAPDNPKALVYLGEHLAFMSGGDENRAEAVTLLTRAAQLAPYMPLPHLALGRALASGGEKERADAELNTAWRLLHAGDRPLQQLDSMAHVERRRAETAYALAALAEKRNDSKLAAIWRSRFREVDARIEKRSRWSVAAQASPPTVNSVLQLAEMDLRTGGAAEARRLASHALRFFPNDASLRRLAAKLGPDE